MRTVKTRHLLLVTLSVLAPSCFKPKTAEDTKTSEAFPTDGPSFKPDKNWLANLQESLKTKPLYHCRFSPEIESYGYYDANFRVEVVGRYSDGSETVHSVRLLNSADKVVAEASLTDPGFYGWLKEEHPHIEEIEFGGRVSLPTKKEMGVNYGGYLFISYTAWSEEPEKAVQQSRNGYLVWKDTSKRGEQARQRQAEHKTPDPRAGHWQGRLNCRISEGLAKHYSEFYGFKVFDRTKSKYRRTKPYE